MTALRAANARLRQVVEAKDTEIAVLRTAHQAQLDALRAQVAALAAEVADLRARLRGDVAELLEAAVVGRAGKAGAEVFCAIRSYLSTAAKHGIGMLDALTRAASREPWIPAPYNRRHGPIQLQITKRLRVRGQVEPSVAEREVLR